MISRPLIGRLIRLIIWLSLGILSCKKQSTKNEESKNVQIKFTTNQHYILKNNVPLNIKGVVYVPGYPGFLPWDIEKSQNLTENLKTSIYKDLKNIKSLGANTIRFWGAPKY